MCVRYVYGLGQRSGNDDEGKLASKVDVSYFRNLLRTETDRLTVLCAMWRRTMDGLPDLSDEGSLQLTVCFKLVVFL